MYCRKCGSPCADDDVFCARCGTKLEKVSTQQDAGQQVPPEQKKADAGREIIPASGKSNPGGFLTAVSIVNLVISSVGLLYTSIVIIGRNHILFSLLSEPVSFICLYGIVYYGFMMFSSIVVIKKESLVNTPKYGIAIIWMTVGSFAVPFLIAYSGLDVEDYFFSMIPLNIMFNWPLRLTFAILYRIAADKSLNNSEVKK